MERPIVVFNHIPKTAGTTLRFILTQNYSPDETLFVDNFLQLPQMREAMRDRDRRRRLKLVYGHAAYAFAVEYPGPVQFVTFLREPFRRLVSHYQYAQRVQEDENHAHSSLGLEDFVRATHMDDYQARQLVFPMRPEFLPDALDKRGMLFQLAMENLANRITFTGIVEKFEESVVMLRDHLKWPKLPIYAPLMVNDKVWKSPFKDDVQRRMRNVYLSVDQILYDHAIRHHEQLWTSDVELHANELDGLKRQNLVVAELLSQRDLMDRQLADARLRKQKENKAELL